MRSLAGHLATPLLLGPAPPPPTNTHTHSRYSQPNVELCSASRRASCAGRPKQAYIRTRRAPFTSSSSSWLSCWCRGGHGCREGRNSGKSRGVPAIPRPNLASKATRNDNRAKKSGCSKTHLNAMPSIHAGVGPSELLTNTRCVNSWLGSSSCLSEGPLAASPTL
jgi:hypothetical protein